MHEPRPEPCNPFGLERPYVVLDGFEALPSGAAEEHDPQLRPGIAADGENVGVAACQRTVELLSLIHI